EVVRELAAAGNSAGFNQRNALPRFAEARIIIFHALERPSQRACRAFGAQSKVHSKQRARGIRRRKRGENLVAQPIKKLVIGNLRRNLALLPVDKEKVNVRAMIQFAAAEFTERKNGKIRCGGAVSFAKFCVAMFEHGADANVRDLRKFTGGLFEGGH